jgi:hypothetical protein
MNDTDTTEVPAVLEAPIGGTEQVGDVTVLQPQGISAADRVAAQTASDKAMKAIRLQPTEKIRVPKVNGPQTVVINGARFNIPANVYVEVPEQVAQVLRDADRI